MKTKLLTTAIALALPFMLSGCGKDGVCHPLKGLMEYAYNNGSPEKDTVTFANNQADTVRFVVRTRQQWGEPLEDFGYSEVCDTWDLGNWYYMINPDYEIWDPDKICICLSAEQDYYYSHYDMTDVWIGEVNFCINGYLNKGLGLASFDTDGNFIKKSFGDTVMLTGNNEYFDFDSVVIIRGIGLESLYNKANQTRYRLVSQ